MLARRIYILANGAQSVYAVVSWSWIPVRLS